MRGPQLSLGLFVDVWDWLACEGWLVLDADEPESLILAQSERWRHA